MRSNVFSFYYIHILKFCIVTFFRVLCGILAVCISICTTYDVVLRARRNSKKQSQDEDIEPKNKAQIPKGPADIELKNKTQIPNGTAEPSVNQNPNLSNGYVKSEQKPRFIATISLTESVNSLTSLESGSRSSFQTTRSTPELVQDKGGEKSEKKERRPKQGILPHHVLLMFHFQFKPLPLLK